MEPQSSASPNPPVVEVVLGVQFAPLVEFASGHHGWFWKGFLARDWVRAVDAPPLPDQFETFEKRRWGPAALHLKVEPVARPHRLQIANQAGDRLIQVQPTQFLYNWQKKGQAY